MNKLITYLKIKHTSLAAEAILIKREEKKWLKQARYTRSKQEDPESSMSIYRDLREHRKAVVAFECRAAHLARAYLTGKAYDVVETVGETWKNQWYNQIQLTIRVAELVRKYESIEAYHSHSRRRPLKESFIEVCTWMNIDAEFWIKTSSYVRNYLEKKNV